MAKTSVKALLVEGDSGHAGPVERVLAEAKFATFTLDKAECLAAALDSMANDEYDVVLLDPDLPDARELTALDELRSRSPDVPVVVIAADVDPRLGVAAAARGAADSVFKNDLSVRALEHVVLRAIRRQATKRTISQANDRTDCKNAELQAANELLDQKNKRLTRVYESAQQFVDNLSHEFRTPLTVIKEFVTLVRDGLAGEVNSQQAEFLDISNDRIDQLAILVDDMLDARRLEMGLLSFWRQNSAIDEIFRNVRPILEQKAAVKKVSIEISLDPSLPAVYCDRDKIGRAIVNLVANAVKFCPDGGSVRIWAKPSSDDLDVVVGVTDDGPGIAPENLERISERLKQAGSEGRATALGCGLGLSLVKELVGLSLGEIDVQSSLGAGSTFSFTVPVYNPRQLATRYARYLCKVQDKPHLAMVAVETSSALDARDSDLADEFLHNVFRAGDMVIRTLPHKWLIMARTHPHEVDTMIARVRNAWSEANTGLYGKKLPEFRFLKAGSWQLPAGNEDFLRLVKSELAWAGQMSGVPSVLLVDDDRDLVRGLSLRLHAAGYEVFTAKDGKAAINSAIEYHPDAILMDNYMPGMNGMRAMDCLGEHPDTKDIPIIMVSASIRDQQKALQQGAKFFFQKPCNHNAIVLAVGNVINDQAGMPSR